MRTPEPLLKYLRVQEFAERNILAMMNRTASKLDGEIKALDGIDRVGARMRRVQLLQAKKTINEEIVALWKLMGAEVMADRIKAAGAAGDVLADSMKIFKRAGLTDKDLRLMRRSLVQSAEQNVEHALSRMKLSKIPLSKRVYKSQVLISGQVDRLVDHHLLRGSSASEIARDVRSFINPKTPGGVRYAAQRLARTELNNAFHATSVMQYQECPFVETVVWNLSGSHPRPDDCNRYAEEVHFDGGKEGQWEPDRVPAKPHPQCLCYTTAETVSDDDFIKSFKSGKYNRWLDSL